MEHGIQKYFIALVLPEPHAITVLKLKQELSVAYNTKGALRSPAHITLHMPFNWRVDRESKIDECLNSFVKEISPFTIELKDFNFFEPRVVFIDVVKNEVLTILQQKLHAELKAKLNLFNADYKERGFHPHVTIAFRDLKKQAFYKIQKEYKEKKFSAQFISNSVALLRHTGKEWLVHKEFVFTLPPSSDRSVS